MIVKAGSHSEKWLWLLQKILFGRSPSAAILQISAVDGMMSAMAANYLTTNAAGICLAVKLQPRAARNEIGPPLGNEIKIKVTAPPVEGAANEALIRFLAETLGCPRSAVQIVRGRTSRHKTVAIAGLGAAEALARLKV